MRISIDLPRVARGAGVLSALASGVLCWSTAVPAAASPPEALGLPDARVYEMVTPPVNQDANVYISGTQSGLSLTYSHEVETSQPVQAAPDGNSVVYVADPTSTGNGNDGNGRGNEYLAKRGPGGWEAPQDIMPAGTRSPTYQAFTSDLSVGFMDSVDPTPLSSEAPGETYDILYTHILSSANYRPLITQKPPNRSPNEFKTYSVSSHNLSTEGSVAYAGASADLGHILFMANDALTAGAIDGGETENNLYDSVAGQLRLVNVLPGGEAEANATFGGPQIGGSETQPNLSHVISTDGSRIFWTDLNSGNLYVRENGTRTVQIDAGVGGGGRFWAASPDGSKVLFTKEGSLYQYVLPQGTTSAIALAAGVQGVVGASEDMAHIYFVATGALAAGAISGRPNLYLSDSVGITDIATLSVEDDEHGFNFGDLQPGLGHRLAQVTPDGLSVAFMSRESLTGYDNEGLEEVFVYDATSGRLSCASCDPSGAPPKVGAGAFVPVSLSNTRMPQWMSADGNRVFFDSYEPLTARDTNGTVDVYEWERAGAGSCQQEGGCVYLLSGGTSPDASLFAEASASGNDVFIATRAQLVPQDRNETVDLYDLRVGGLRAATPSACSGTGCQGLPAAPPIFATPASVTFNGVGNFSTAVKVAAKAKKSKPKRRAAKRRRPRKKARRRSVSMRTSAHRGVRGDGGRS